MLKVVWKGRAIGVNKWVRSRVVSNKYHRPWDPKSKPYLAVVYETKEYKEFKDSLKSVMVGPRMRGYVDLRIEVCLSTGADTDGPIKPIMDALKEAEVIEDDRFVRNLKVLRSYHKKGLKDIIAVEIYKAGLDRDGQQPLIGDRDEPTEVELG